MKFLATLLLCFFLASCGESENKTSTTEKVETEKMDSTSKQIEKVKDDLEDQTEKVEKSLEDLDDDDK